MRYPHTPGPWQVIGGSVYGYGCDSAGEPTQPIAHMDRRPGNGTVPTERDSNAKLIALAPRMAAALAAIEATYRTFRNVPKEQQEWTSLDDDALTETQAILRTIEEDQR